MSIPLYLAMTAVDFSSPLPERAAWMAVQFSMADSGVSNLPTSLPSGSLVILNDQIPWNHHNEAIVCGSIVDLLLKTDADGLLLDFERPPRAETYALARSLAAFCREMGCPIAMPQEYLSEEPSAVFLPPLPCWQTPSLPDTREVWLEFSPTGCRAAIGPDGVTIEEADPWALYREAEEHTIFTEPNLCCRYFTEARKIGIQVSLFDTQTTLLEKISRLPQVTRAVGIYREQKDW